MTTPTPAAAAPAKRLAHVAPANRPSLVAIVLIDDPRGEEYYGGQVAAPVFSEVMTGALRLLNIPPDELPIADQVTGVATVAEVS